VLSKQDGLCKQKQLAPSQSDMLAFHSNQGCNNVCVRVCCCIHVCRWTTRDCVVCMSLTTPVWKRLSLLMSPTTSGVCSVLFQSRVQDWVVLELSGNLHHNIVNALSLGRTMARRSEPSRRVPLEIFPVMQTSFVKIMQMHFEVV